MNSSIKDTLLTFWRQIAPAFHGLMQDRKPLPKDVGVPFEVPPTETPVSASVTEPFRITGPGLYRRKDGEEATVDSFGDEGASGFVLPLHEHRMHWNIDGVLADGHPYNLVAFIRHLNAPPTAEPVPVERFELPKPNGKDVWSYIDDCMKALAAQANRAREEERLMWQGFDTFRERVRTERYADVDALKQQANFEASAPNTKQYKGKVWVNAYRNGTFFYYFAREEADAYAGPNRLACVEVDFEYDEGDGL